MNKLQIMISVLILSLLIVGCSSIAPKPTSTPLPTTTQTPLPSAIPSETPMPSLTPTQVPTPEPTEDPILALMPHGEPDAEWLGIPIMPDAVAGEGDSGSYIFTINATKFEIKAFYDKELRKLGWEQFATGTNDAGEIKMILYSKDDAFTAISLFEGPDGLVIVMFITY